MRFARTSAADRRAERTNDKASVLCSSRELTQCPPSKKRKREVASMRQCSVSTFIRARLYIELVCVQVWRIKVDATGCKPPLFAFRASHISSILVVPRLALEDMRLSIAGSSPDLRQQQGRRHHRPQHFERLTRPLERAHSHTHSPLQPSLIMAMASERRMSIDLYADSRRASSIQPPPRLAPSVETVPLFHYRSTRLYLRKCVCVCVHKCVCECRLDVHCNALLLLAALLVQYAVPRSISTSPTAVACIAVLCLALVFTSTTLQARCIY